MPFTQTDADTVELSSAWWSTRSHRAPLGVRTREYNDLVVAIRAYETAIENHHDPSTAWDGITHAIDELRRAVDAGRLIGFKIRRQVGDGPAQQGRVGVVVPALPLMATKAGRRRHQHFFAALSALAAMQPGVDEGYVPLAYRY